MGAAAEARPRLDHATDIQGAGVRLWSHRAGRFDAPVSAHPTIELAWVEAGQVTYHFAGRRIAVGAGEAIVVPRGVEHATGFAGPAIAGALALGADMVAEVADALGGRAVALEPGKVIASSRVAALGKLVREEVAGKESGYLLTVDALAEAMTVSMLRGAGERTSGPTTRDPRVRAVLDLIHGSYSEPIGIDDLARAAGTSRFHMSRLFRDAVGQSPYRYLVRVRIERAAELLRSGRRSVTEVAFAVGFGDLGRFARTFRQMLGVSPGSFAKGARR